MLMCWTLLMACGQKEQGTQNTAEEPTSDPVSSPTSDPSTEPSASPTSDPSSEPSSSPTSDPSSEPTSEPTSEPLEIAGSYSDNIGSEHVISQTLWLIDYGSSEQYYYHIEEYSNSEDFLVAENDPDNGPPEAGAWSRFDWVYQPDGSLWVCQTQSTAPTVQDALNAQAPDVNDAGSCTPYGWMQLY